MSIAARRVDHGLSHMLVFAGVAAGLSAAAIGLGGMAPRLLGGVRPAAVVTRILADTLCATSAEDDASRPVGSGVPVTSKALPNVPGKRITVLKVAYQPGGYTPAHTHSGSVTAYVTSGHVRSQLGGGPVETFGPGDTFFEPPGTQHLVSENASMTESAELIAVFVADEGAELTTFLD